MLCRGWRVEMFFGRDQVNACGAESAISLAGVGGYGFFRDLLQDWGGEAFPVDLSAAWAGVEQASRVTTSWE
jgi:hypothetical protein